MVFMVHPMTTDLYASIVELKFTFVLMEHDQLVTVVLAIYMFHAIWEFELSADSTALSGDPQWHSAFWESPVAQCFLEILIMCSDFWGSPDVAPFLGAGCGYEATCSAISHE